MEQAVIAALLLVGLVIGAGVGASFARAKRGWTDYQTIRTSVPGARRNAWLAIRGVVVKLAVIALLLVGAAAYAASGGGEERTGPTPSATPTPSHRAGR
ncbi:hypothetical protein [Micromonospora sp. WMMA1947]|uniref:hypothetical protein n=1 Tax=Micromonospora sp. WMMA1947 TaxID=3015163 RepID=UPI00248AC7F8|nr:hypothetical protein [Micromonospora sp. WMMA1947]WBC09862.1 hypothetical protein O7604_02965 [Micromonospora sp. WMMA1947]